MASDAVRRAPAAIREWLVALLLRGEKASGRPVSAPAEEDASIESPG
jgi:hypothetical protein